MPSRQDSRRFENTVMNSVVIKRLRSLFTSATFPRRPIIFLKSSSLSGKLYNCNEIKD